MFWTRLCAYTCKYLIIVSVEANHISTFLVAPQCRVVSTQVVEAFVQCFLWCVLYAVNNILLEELKTMVVATHLSGVDHRHTRNNICECCEEVCSIAHTLKLGTIPRVLVMVRCEVHTDSLFADSGVYFSKITP